MMQSDHPVPWPVALAANCAAVSTPVPAMLAKIASSSLIVSSRTVKSVMVSTLLDCCVT
jgi:hypothetical protein